MPLIKSASKKAVSENIRREMDSGKKQSQAVAIALSIARRAKRASGGPAQLPDQDRLERGDKPNPNYYGGNIQRGGSGGGNDLIEGSGADRRHAGYDAGGSVRAAMNIVRRKKFSDGGASTPPFERTEARDMVKSTPVSPTSLTSSSNPISRVKGPSVSIGPVVSPVPGRTDKIPVSVPPNSYVISADVVSGLPGAENNSMAGHRILDRMFKQGPYDSSPERVPVGHWNAPPRTKFGSVPQSKGGHVSGKDKPVPIIVAGGEYIIGPDAVARVGGGDHKRGHEILDKFCLEVRKKHIKTLSGLPPPVKK